MKKKLVLFISALMLVLGLVGCSEVQNEETQFTDELMTQAYDTVGFPDVTNYFERSQLKEIYELRDNPKLICYWYTKNDMSGKWIYQGSCIGYGIPYTTSMTATESVQKIDYGADWNFEILPLAEPNGLYSSTTTSATWILATDEKGNITPQYVEQEVMVSQTKTRKELCEDWSIPSGY